MGSLAHHHLYTCPVTIIGDTGVGKSNLSSRLIYNKFSLDSKPTKGIDFSSRTFNVDGKNIRYQIWDTSGEDRFRSLISAYCRDTLGIVIVYDITRKVTFENVERWLKEVRNGADQTAVIMLIGNKTDLAHIRAVPTDEAKAFSEKENILFMETSALDALNVKKAFRELLTQIHRRKALGKANEPKRQTVNIQGKDDQERLEEKSANTGPVTRPSDDPQLCGVNNDPHYTVNPEVGTSGTGTSVSCLELEEADLKEKRKAVVHVQNGEVLTRELKLLRTSVDMLRSTMEEMLAQQRGGATRHIIPHDPPSN